MWRNKSSTIVKESKKKQNSDRRCLRAWQNTHDILEAWCKEFDAGIVYKVMGRVKGPTREDEAPLAKAGRHRIWRNKEGKQRCQNPRAVTEAEDHIPGAGNWWSEVLEVRGRITSRGGRTEGRKAEGWKRVVEGWEAWKRREGKLENLF